MAPLKDGYILTFQTERGKDLIRMSVWLWHTTQSNGNKKVVFASPHSQRFEHLETYCLRLLRLCFTSYVLNLSAENKKSKTTTLMSHSSLTLYSCFEGLSRECISSGNVHVVDTGNNRVQKFDSNGTFLATWGSYGAENGQFNNPQGVMVDAKRGGVEKMKYYQKN